MVTADVDHRDWQVRYRMSCIASATPGFYQSPKLHYKTCPRLLRRTADEGVIQPGFTQTIIIINIAQ
jgi:hypothetical protein